MTDGNGAETSRDTNGERNADRDAWLDALADGDGYALVCPDGHGSLPPRRVCPECGSTDMSREPFRDAGTVETFSVVHVPSPGFADEAPYVSAIVDVGPTRLTGVLRGVDAESDAVEVGVRVAVAVEERSTDGEPLVVFRPVREE